MNQQNPLHQHTNQQNPLHQHTALFHTESLKRQEQKLPVLYKEQETL